MEPIIPSFPNVQPQPQPGLPSLAVDDDDACLAGIPSTDAPRSIDSNNAAQRTQALPSITLKCLECDFMCTSNNQMCRHIYLTSHCLAPCPDCNAKLVCWTFAPGVQKLLARARKDGVVVDPPLIDTVEKHQERSGHKVRCVPPKEAFILPGNPEEYGMKPISRNSAAPAPEHTKFQCPDCLRVFATWTQITKHLDVTKHSLARCAECDLVLRCYGAAQPLRHEKITGHRGVVGMFRAKPDYCLDVTGPPSVRQYKCPNCPLWFLHPLHIARHFNEEHHANIACPPCAACKQSFGSFKDAITHRLQTAHDQFNFSVDDSAQLDEFLVRLYYRRQIEEPTTSGDCRILYQCPDCFLLFTSWTKAERHLSRTKHTLPFCMECQQHLKPKGANTNDGHAQSQDHHTIIGEQKCKSDYEVLVDVRLDEMVELIDNDDLAQLVEKEHERVVYQCPLCHAVFTGFIAFEEHVVYSRHGVIRCDACDQDVTILHSHFLKHTKHTIPNVPSWWSKIKYGEDFRVCIGELELLEFYPEQFMRCAECQCVVEVSHLKQHQGMQACLIAKAARECAAEAEHLEADLPVASGASLPAVLAAPPPPPPYGAVARDSSGNIVANNNNAPKANHAKKPKQPPAGKAAGKKQPRVPAQATEAKSQQQPKESGAPKPSFPMPAPQYHWNPTPQAAIPRPTPTIAPESDAECGIIAQHRPSATALPRSHEQCAESPTAKPPTRQPHSSRWCSLTPKGVW